MMKLNRVLIILLMISLVFITGCGSEKVEEEKVSGNRVPIVPEGFNYRGSGMLNCIQGADGPEGVEVDLDYIVKYVNGNIVSLKSTAVVVSDNFEQLNSYEYAYKSIMANYKGLEYYDTTLDVSDNKVIYTSLINYAKIDTNKLLAIEGAEDNIIQNGKAKLSLWLELAQNVGVTCEVE